MPTSAVTYSDHQASEALSRHVVNYWTLGVSPGARDLVHFVPPDGCTHLAFNGPLSVLIGPHVRPLRPPLTPGARWFGIRFRPGAARLFFRSSALPCLRNSLVRGDGLGAEAWVAGLGDAIGGVKDGGECDVANHVLEEMVPAAGEVSPLVHATVHRLLASGGRARVTELARLADVSERHLRRVFRAHVDLSPKEFASAWRLRLCALGTLQASPDWAALAAETGFADQAHLTREFRRWVGLTPQALARQTAAIEHRELRWPAPTP